ncbi:MAG: TlpA family protein disulfide reductase, partial [Nitrospinota bacterium]
MRRDNRSLAESSAKGTPTAQERTGTESGGSRLKRSWWKILLPLSVIPLLLLLAYGLGKDPRQIPSPLIGRPAPDFSLTLLDGKTLHLSELQGKVVVVNFWASWCYPACWNEAPLWEQAWNAYRDRGVVIVGIAFQD